LRADNRQTSISADANRRPIRPAPAGFSVVDANAHGLRSAEAFSNAACSAWRENAGGSSIRAGRLPIFFAALPARARFELDHFPGITRVFCARLLASA